MKFKITCLILCLSFKAMAWSEIKGWKYIPQNEKFWITYIEKSQNTEPALALEYFLELASNKDINSLDGAEFFIALADSLVRNNFPQAGYSIYLNILKKHPGSSLSQKSLVEIEKLAETQDLDEVELARVINQASFSETPEQAMDMLLYYTSLDNMKRHLYRWAQRSLRNISETSYWGLKIKYLKSIELYQNGKIEETEIELDKLLATPNLPARLKWQIQWQRARMAFERKKYDLAEKLYTSTTFPPRLAGRILMERAWNMFYQKNFAGTLGLYESMLSNSFRNSFSPEQTILAMMTYREVCHYGKVAKIADDFNKKYRKTYDSIRRGLPLLENTAIMWLALQRPTFRDTAEVVDSIQKESKRTLGMFSSRGNKASQLISKFYKEAPAELKKRNEYRMKDALKGAAEFFVQHWDRIKLVDYISKLDKFRIKQVFEERSYIALRSEPSNYDKLFWPANGERWADEFRNYQVILSDRCQQNGPARRSSR